MEPGGGTLQAVDFITNVGSFALLAYLAILTARHAPSVIERVLTELEAQRKARDAAERAFTDELRVQRNDFRGELMAERELFRTELRTERELFERKVAAILIAVKEAGPEAIEKVAAAMNNNGRNGS